MEGQASAVVMRAQGKGWEDSTKDLIHSFIHLFTHSDNYYVPQVCIGLGA